MIKCIKCNVSTEQVRLLSVFHFSEEDILSAFQSKVAELRTRREEGLQDLHEAYQVTVSPTASQIFTFLSRFC